MCLMNHNLISDDNFFASAVVDMGVKENNFPHWKLLFTRSPFARSLARCCRFTEKESQLLPAVKVSVLRDFAYMSKSSQDVCVTCVV